ncbi:hypothetical protein Droror1_Dr00020757, partial [Drosera rotundifolia]
AEIRGRRHFNGLHSLSVRLPRWSCSSSPAVCQISADVVSGEEAMDEINVLQPQINGAAVVVEEFPSSSMNKRRMT